MKKGVFGWKRINIFHEVKCFIDKKNLTEVFNKPSKN